MRCPRYGNGGRMHVIPNGESLEEVVILSTWDRKWQLKEDVKGALKSTPHTQNE